MRPLRTLILLAASLAACAACRKEDVPSPPAASPPPARLSKDTPLGSGVSPAHHPAFTMQDIDDYFALAVSVGSHVVFITEWADELPDSTVTLLLGKARARDLSFHLYLSPVTLSAARDAPAIPPSVTGTSFGDATVRQAFKDRALALAALSPDLLGLGTEVNLLAANPSEFAHYATLYQEAVSAVKAAHPSQRCTVSFQWDVMLAGSAFAPLTAFGSAPDVWAFTTYPHGFGDASLVPDAYYSSVRSLLPTQAIGFSEVGWAGWDAASEAQQAAFWARLPSLMAGASPSFVSMSLMHDVTLFSGPLEPLNHTGVRRVDGTPKPAWDVVGGLAF